MPDDVVVNVEPAIVVAVEVYTFGPQGPSGTGSGNFLLNGTAAPTGGVGNNGDFYIRVVSGVPTTLYGPKASGVWPAGVLLVPTNVTALEDAVEALTETLAEHIAATTSVHGIDNTAGLPQLWVSNGTGGYVLTNHNRLFYGGDDASTATPGGRENDWDAWIDTSP